VDPHVLGEVGAVGEGLATVAAFVGFGFSHMDLGVELQVRLGAETLWAHLALVLPLAAAHVVVGEAHVAPHRAHLGCIDGLRHHQHAGAGRREGGEV